MAVAKKSELNDELSRAERAANSVHDPRAAGWDHFAEKSLDEPDAVTGYNSDMLGSLKSEIMNLAENVFDHFVGTSKVLVDALNELSTAHPFIRVAFLAFKAVIELDIKRRENDKRILALRYQMQDMIIYQVAIPQETIEQRLSKRMEDIANDIEGCANTCNVWTKKRTIVKVFKSPGWERKFNDYVETFQKHQVSIHADLDLQVSAGISSANEAIARVKSKVDLIVFHLLRSSAEKDVVSHMDRKSPEAYLKNDKKLLSLIRLSKQKVIERRRDKGAGVSSRNHKDVDDEDGIEVKLLVDIKHEMAVRAWLPHSPHVSLFSLFCFRFCPISFIPPNTSVSLFGHALPHPPRPPAPSFSHLPYFVPSLGAPRASAPERPS
ncbi:hypothetical protein PUNSTDRAFT_136685 [Punctularia strigosozonata HHB-11173 SS5]|uniref:uncharacterized protein n=1 Tax=Punctularia strigosozonata (strain HHB-11173) TaxID=741275 RepID=UPI0004417577|nr:uncharacterized protein PUNSTDRAFT_136685 [Punctularia strigosozonata HHB-11173 SS5]EIN06857.1 hypothetical protein PUNSTDRAFT_136685 [Punctularia strigosozonata HHB-11173 SS5]